MARHTAIGWNTSWLPGRVLTQSEAVTAEEATALALEAVAG